MKSEDVKVYKASWENVAGTYETRKRMKLVIEPPLRQKEADEFFVLKSDFDAISLELRKAKREIEVLGEEKQNIIAAFKRTKRALSRLVAITVRPNELVKNHVINDAKDALRTAEKFTTRIEAAREEIHE